MQNTQFTKETQQTAQFLQETFSVNVKKPTNYVADTIVDMMLADKFVNIYIGKGL